MPINFNVDPWYDDFDQTKNFHRILFKPGRAVQARELTQAQTILQDQITKFADNIFKQNSPVTGGQLTTNLNVFYVKLQDSYNNSIIDVTSFENLLVKNSDGTVIARVVSVAAASGGDPPTLMITYITGNKFASGDTVYLQDSNYTATIITETVTNTATMSVGTDYPWTQFNQNAFRLNTIEVNTTSSDYQWEMNAVNWQFTPTQDQR